MGGPYWQGKLMAAWSLAKGIYDPALETPEAAARREFTEEVGVPVPEGDLIDLGQVRLSSGKYVRGYGVEASRDLAFMSSNTFELEWPPKSGQLKTYPEVDEARWFRLDEAKRRIVKGQLPLLETLRLRLD